VAIEQVLPRMPANQMRVLQVLPRMPANQMRALQERCKFFTANASQTISVTCARVAGVYGSLRVSWGMKIDFYYRGN